MTREESFAKAIVCDIVVSGHEEADVGMPAANGHGVTQRGRGRVQAPDGTSCGEPPVLAGVLGTQIKSEIKIRDRARIAHRHDAILTALNADPAALLIKAPCKVTAPQVRCLVYLGLFSSLLRALLR